MKYVKSIKPSDVYKHPDAKNIIQKILVEHNLKIINFRQIEKGDLIIDSVSNGAGVFGQPSDVCWEVPNGLDFVRFIVQKNNTNTDWWE